MIPSFWNHIPLLSILLPAAAGVVCALLRRERAARRLTLAALALTAALSALFTACLALAGAELTALPSPWGGELCAGATEGALACALSLLTYFSLLGGLADVRTDIRPHRQRLYFVLLHFLLAAGLTVIYAGDLVTAYLAMALLTLTGCALIAAGENGRSQAAALAALLPALLGGALVLAGGGLLISLTGESRLSALGQAIPALLESGAHRLPLRAGAGCLFLGLAVLSALFPFHAALPAAHAAATTTSAALFSGLLVQAGPLLAIRLIARAFTPETAAALGLTPLLFVLGGAGVIAGSVLAVRETRWKRMLAASTIAQVGLIYVAAGLGGRAALAAGLFQLICHGAAKTLLFLSGAALARQCGGTTLLREMRGAARRDRVAGVGFALGALSLIGLPLLAGFAAKLTVMGAARVPSLPQWAAMALLALSSVFNALHLLPAVGRIWTREEGETAHTLPGRAPAPAARAAIAAMAALLFALGIWFQPALALLRSAL